MSMRIERVTKLTQEINISLRLVVVSRVLIVHVKSIEPIVLEYLNGCLHKVGTEMRIYDDWVEIGRVVPASNRKE